MRGLLEGTATPAPLADILPAMLREDLFARQLCAGLDEVLTPVLLSLDSFAAYLDVGTTPEDMLPWLGQWLGVNLDPRQEAEAQRELLGAGPRTAPRPRHGGRRRCWPSGRRSGSR